MASPEQGLIVVTVVQASNLPSTILPKVFVEIALGGLRRRTESIKRKGNVCTWGDAEFAFPILGGPSKIAFSLLHERFLHDKCLGRLEIDVDGLLERQRQRTDEVVILSLTDKKGNPSTARLTIRIAQQSLSTVAGTATEQALVLANDLTRPHIIETMSNDVTDLTNTASNEQNLVSSFGSLLDKIGVLLTVGDEIAKIHPYVNFAWQVLSVGLKMVQAQQKRDQEIQSLITTMEDTYSFVTSMDELKKSRVLRDIVEQILKQTIECGYFIREYMRHNFGEQVITQPFTGTKDRISAFCTAFGDLRETLDSRLSLSTALVLSRTTVTIDAIRRDQLLSTLKSVEMPEHNRKACLSKTRQDVIKAITDWIADESSDQQQVLWLYGLAGSGKSTISTTIAWMMQDLHRLGAFFFFDRDIPERNAATLIRTLAHQLAQFDPHIGENMSKIVESNPRITDRPLYFQWASLLSSEALRSVEWSGGPIIVVIDALDECENETGRKALMQTLSKGLSDLPPFIRLVVVSRAEPDIQRVLGFHSTVHQCPLSIDSPTNKADISEFVRWSLDEIRVKNKYLGADWPGHDKTSALTASAGGLFVWASTACLYIDSYDPDERLEELITHQSEINSSEPFAQLDRLYKTGLQSAGLWNQPSFRSDCCNILGAVLCARTPLSCSMINTLLSLPRSRSCLQAISRLGCVLRISETEGIRILHPSFHDYLSKRCNAEPWSINLDLHNKGLALHCMELLRNTLRVNICGLALSRPVQNETLPDGVSYACKFWVEHICLISHDTDHVIDRIYSFLDQHLLHWIEALAVLKSHDTTIHSLQLLLQWLQKSSPKNTDLHELVYDGHHFAQFFANTIEEHPLLLYVSALPFTPAKTSIYKRFYHDGLPKVCGMEKSWPRELRQLRGHDGEVYSVAFSPDGSKIASGSEDKTIRVWDANTGVEMLPPLLGHDGRILSVAFSPDDGSKIMGSLDKTIRVWDASTGVELLPPLQGHDGRILSVAFSPDDGSKIISGSLDKTIRVWDASTGVELLPPLRGHNDTICSVAFSPDRSKIVSGSDDKTIRVWDASTGVELLPLLQGHNGGIFSVAFSPDGSKIASGSYDETIRVWDVSTGVELLPPLRGHDGRIFSVAFSPDGTKIASGSEDQTIQVWDASTGIQLPPPLRGHNDWIRSVAFSPDGSKIVSGSDDKTIRVWDASTDVKLQGHNSKILSVAFSPDGLKIASGYEDKTIRVWDASTGVELLPPLQGHDGRILSVAFSPDGSNIVSGSYDETIRVWDASTSAELLPPLRGHNDPIRSVAFSPDGSKIISGSLDKTIRVWDASTGVELLPPLQGHNDTIRSVAFSPDGSKIVSGSEDDTIRVWDASTGVEMLLLLQSHNGGISSVAFSPDGSKIVSGSIDNIIQIWNASTGIEMLPLLHTHNDWNDSIHSVTFSPDGSKIICESDRTIRVWHANTGLEILPGSSEYASHSADEVSIMSPTEGRLISFKHEWFTDLSTGCRLGRLPVGTSHYRLSTVHGSSYVGCTIDHKLIIIQFPE